MKNSTFDVALLILASGFSCLVFALMCGFLVQSARVTQKELNDQCKTNYSVSDVLLSSQQLIELCRIKQQQIHLNQ